MRTCLALLLASIAVAVVPTAAHADPLLPPDPLICVDAREVYVREHKVDPPNVCLL